MAHAGADQSVASGALVVLDGSGSIDVNGEPLRHAWTQTSGPTVSLMGRDEAIAAFRAPTVAVPTTLTFRLTVSDGILVSSDDAGVTVLAPPCR